MKALFTIHYKMGKLLTGQDIAVVVQNIAETLSSAKYRKELSLSDDSGDYYTIGLQSQYPGEDMVVVSLPSQKAEISMDEFIRYGSIAVMSWDFGAPKCATTEKPEAIRNAALNFRNMIEERINS
jgi:hypothetical protein